MVQTEAVLRVPIGTSGFPPGAEVWPVPLAGAAFETATTIISGPRSSATDTLLARCQRELPAGVVQWIECGAQEASESLASGLCHAAALTLDDALAGGPADPRVALAGRIGDLALLEITRTGSARQVLVLPAPTWDSSPAMGLRKALLMTDESPAERYRITGLPEN